MIQDALSEAVSALPAGRVPKGFQAQARALGGRGKTPAARLSAQFGVTERTARKWIAGGAPSKANRARVERAIQDVAHQRRLDRARELALAGGLRIETRARFGYLAPAGTSNDPRLRRITATMGKQFIGPLFQAYSQGNEEAMNRVVANGILYDYFKDGGRRAHDLDVVFEDIDYVEMEIQ